MDGSQGDQMIWKKLPNSLKNSQNSCQTKNTKLETIFKMAYLGENVINLEPKVLPFLGYFFIEPTKSSLICEKLPNMVTLMAVTNALITVGLLRVRVAAVTFMSHVRYRALRHSAYRHSA